MAEIVTPTTLEAFAEKQIKALLEAQLTLIPDVNVLTGHTLDDESIDQEAPVITVTVTREEEDIPNSGWWVCAIEAELDPRDLSDSDIETTWLQIETALGNGGGDIETQITSGRLKCMTGSAFYDQALEYEVSQAERTRVYAFTASLGMTAS